MKNNARLTVSLILTVFLAGTVAHGQTKQENYCLYFHMLFKYYDNGQFLTTKELKQKITSGDLRASSSWLSNDTSHLIFIKFCLAPGFFPYDIGFSKTDGSAKPMKIVFLHNNDSVYIDSLSFQSGLHILKPKNAEPFSYNGKNYQRCTVDTFPPVSQQTTSTYKQKKYPVNKYLDSLIRTTHLVEIAEIDSDPDTNAFLCGKENGKTVYEFSLQKIKRFNKKEGYNEYPNISGVGGRPLIKTTNVRYIVNENDQSNIRLLKKGKQLIFFVKTIKTGGTSTDMNCMDVVGFVKATKENIDYILHTFRETKNNVTLSLYHTAKKPRRDKNFLGRREHYWIYYENGNIQRETIYKNRLVFRHFKGIGFKLFYLKYYELWIYYYENGIPKEKIENKYKINKTDNPILTSDTTKFDITGKIIYQSKK